MTILDSYRVSVKAMKPGEIDPVYTYFDVQTSGGPAVASVLAIKAARRRFRARRRLEGTTAMTADLDLCRIETEMRMLRANIARDRLHLRRLSMELLLHALLQRCMTDFLREAESK